MIYFRCLKNIYDVKNLLTYFQLDQFIEKISSEGIYK